MKQQTSTQGAEIYDPLEKSNRAVFSFNAGVDKAIVHPIVKGYQAITPKPARTGLRNVLRTLRSPVNLGNQLLQGDLEGSANTLTRTAVNVLVGGFGLFDVAGYEGIEYEPEDFGQTLAVWGVPHGPYLVVPLLGPSSARDYAGYFVDAFADPLRWYWFNIEEKHLYYTRSALEYLDLRESLIDVLTDLEASSVDYYASVRSIYYQRREALVEDRARIGAPVSAPSIPDYDDEDFEDDFDALEDADEEVEYK